MLPRRLKEEFRAAGDRRRRGGRILLEGERVVATAVSAGLVLDVVAVDRERVDLALLYPTCHRLTRDEVAQLASTKSPPPILALAAEPDAPRESELPACATRGLVALDGVQDPGNVGSIIRTAEAFGLGGVLVSADGADPWSAKVIRGSMGAVLSLPIWRVDALAVTLATLAAGRVDLFFAATRGGLDPEHVTPSGGWCVVMGSEAAGLRGDVAALPGTALTLPIGGRVGSLGVAAAAAILVHRLARARLRGS